MASKIKKVNKADKTTTANVSRKAKPTARRAGAKVQPGKKGGTAAKTEANAASKPVAGKAKPQEKEPVGFIQNVKDHIHSGMEAIGEAIKKITPDALLSKSAKSK